MSDSSDIEEDQFNREYNNIRAFSIKRDISRNSLSDFDDDEEMLFQDTYLKGRKNSKHKNPVPVQHSTSKDTDLQHEVSTIEDRRLTAEELSTDKTPIENSSKPNTVSMVLRLPQQRADTLASKIQNNQPTSQKSGRPFGSGAEKSRSTSSIVTRCKEWESARREKILVQQRSKQNQEIKECSFRPKINQHTSLGKTVRNLNSSSHNLSMYSVDANSESINSRKTALKDILTRTRQRLKPNSSSKNHNIKRDESLVSALAGDTGQSQMMIERKLASKLIVSTRNVGGNSISFLNSNNGLKRSVNGVANNSAIRRIRNMSSLHPQQENICPNKPRQEETPSMAQEYAQLLSKADKLYSRLKTLKEQNAYMQQLLRRRAIN